MKISDSHSFTTDHRSLETVCGTMLLGRLGTEIARIYDEALAAPLPERLRRLIDEIERSDRFDNPES